jgi:hypothetical protein
MNQIEKPSRRFAMLFRVLFFLYPVALLVLWLEVVPGAGDQWLELDVLTAVAPTMTGGKILPWQRLACFGAAMLPGAAVMYAYRELWRLFELYASGTFFEQENVACCRALGWALMAQQLLALPEEAIQTAVLTALNPEGQRSVTVSLEDGNLTLVVVGLMLILVSRVMDEGRKLQEEQRLTV